MKKLLTLMALAGFAAGAVTPSLAIAVTGTPGVYSANVLQAQEDCKAGEKWNEETKKCEAESG